MARLAAVWVIWTCSMAKERVSQKSSRWREKQERIGEHGGAGGGYEKYMGCPKTMNQIHLIIRYV